MSDENGSVELGDLHDHQTRLYRLLRSAFIAGLAAFLYFGVVAYWRADQLDKLEDDNARFELQVQDQQVVIAELRTENAALEREKATLQQNENLLIAHVQGLMLIVTQLSEAQNHTEPGAPTVDPTLPVPTIPHDDIHAGIPAGTPNPHGGG